MATKIWQGYAPAVAQVDTITISGTWANGDVATITINGKSVACTVAGMTGSDHAYILAALTAMLSASTIPEFAEITWLMTTDTTLAATAGTPGVPFELAASCTTAGDGDLVASAGTANAGPADGSTAVNWSTGSVPTTGDDVVFEATARDLLYGLDFSAATFASLTIRQSFSGQIGLPRTHVVGSTVYAEYRDQYFKLGCSGTISIGGGAGSGSGRIKLDTNNVATTVLIANSGNQAEIGMPAVLLTNTHSSTTLAIFKGTVGHCLFAGETGSLDTLTIGYRANRNQDAAVACGDGSAIAFIEQSGGTLGVRNNISPITIGGGILTVDGTATIGVLDINRDGTVIDRSIGAFATVSLAGEYDRTQDMRDKTIANLTVYADAKYRDPFGAVAVAGGITFHRCSPSDLKAFETRPHQTWTAAAI